MKNNKGFTIIELLVVAAIVALMASVVFAAMRGAANKGSNSTIKGDMHFVRQQAALVYDNAGGKYDNICADATIQRSMVSIQNASSATNANNYAIGTGGSAGTVTCHSSSSGWAVESPLKVAEGSNTFWCDDWAGTSKGEVGSTLTANTVTCP